MLHGRESRWLIGFLAVLMPDAGRAAQEEPHGPGKYDRLDAGFLANLQLILIAIQRKTPSKTN
ncbi:hypothetical protein [Bifidobacterium hapali]|uniref:hypothetical protein n=1 Tax=Bifidobacterium hapali TaxID=1630172 RepID=UPI0011776151|nr:hypothetical protein [Bifidobacterium hapali]